MKNSVAHFDQAIRLDSNYALAYAALADSYITLGDYRSLPARESYPKAKAAALKALELDDTLAEAHTSLAMIKASYEWDWPTKKITCLLREENREAHEARERLGSFACFVVGEFAEALRWRIPLRARAVLCEARIWRGQRCRPD